MSGSANLRNVSDIFVSGKEDCRATMRFTREVGRFPGNRSLFSRSKALRQSRSDLTLVGEIAREKIAMNVAGSVGQEPRRD